MANSQKMKAMVAAGKTLEQMNAALDACQAAVTACRSAGLRHEAESWKNLADGLLTLMELQGTTAYRETAEATRSDVKASIDDLFGSGPGVIGIILL